jgi:hypothetical protein
MNTAAMTIAEDDEAEVDQDKSEWVSHPYTKNLLAQTKTKEQAALSALVNACNASTDLRIVQKWSQYEHLRMLGEVLRRGQEKK